MSNKTLTIVAALVITALVAAGLFLVFGDCCKADTVFLKNGRSFHGKVFEGKDSKDRTIDNRLYKVEFGESGSKGYMYLRKTEVKKIEKNDKDAFKDHTFDLKEKK